MKEGYLSLSGVSIILVEPQMGENIGAAARAMKNFAISDLRIISPRDGWPSEKANSMSVGAIDVIENAKIYGSLPSAIEDLEYIYAATAASRDMNKRQILSQHLVEDCSEYNKIGIMFGRESSGLNNHEISYANKIVTIDTDVNFSSLNIAHSVAVICSQLFQGKRDKVRDLGQVQELANFRDLEYFYDHLFESLDRKSFFRNDNQREHMILKLRNLFNRVDNLSKQEVQMLRGVISSFTKNE